VSVVAAPESDQERSDPTSTGHSQVPLTADEIFNVDERLFVLERQGRLHARTIIGLQDATASTIVGISVLEIVFAIFLAMNVWTLYRGTSRSSSGAS
jgi:hypothetical protein